MNVGWLDDLTEWLGEKLAALVTAIVAVIKDALFWLAETALDLWARLVEAIPVPDWLASVSLCSILSSAGPTVGWLLNTFAIGEAMGIIAAAWAFRLLRKLFTLGQW